MLYGRIYWYKFTLPVVSTILALNLLLHYRYVLNRKMITTRGIKTIWESNSPDQLVDLAARCILRNPKTLFYAIDVTRTKRRAGSVVKYN